MKNTFPARLLAVAVTLALASCSGIPGKTRVAPDAATTALPALFPGAATTSREGLAIERWWLHFGDAGLERLIDEALARNEDLEAAVARVREAQAALDAADAARSPSVDLNAKSSRQQSSELGSMPVPPGVGRRVGSHRLSFDAGYEIDLWGKLSAGSAAARSQLLATEWARAAVEWSLTARLAEAYFGLAAVDRQVEISEAMRQARAAALDLRRREFAAGAGQELDLRRAEAELSGTDATLASLGRQRAQLERALTALLGRTPQQIAAAGLDRGRLDESLPYAAVVPGGAAADLLVRRPDIRQAEAELASANYSIEAARAATLPALRLTGSLGSDARSVSDLFSGPAAIWSIGGSLTQAIVDGGRARSRFDQEKARAEQSLAGYRKTVAGAVLEVQEAYAVLDMTQRAYLAERDRAAALERARELARRGHAAGALAYLDYLDADRSWHQARLQQVAAYRDQLVGQISAFKALGGGHAYTGSNS